MRALHQGKYRWVLLFDKTASVTTTSKHLLRLVSKSHTTLSPRSSVPKMIPDVMDQQGRPFGKFRTRRFKANARERHRMHALNSALDKLRRSVKLQKVFVVFFNLFLQIFQLYACSVQGSQVV